MADLNKFIEEDHANGMLDKYMYDAIESNMNMSVPWYLLSSYAYYEKDEPILTDSAFDKLSQKMMNSWDSIVHQHKDLITVDMLKAGSYIGTYPSILEGALKSLKETYYGRKNSARSHH